jgi:hypothetical protein
VKTNTIHSKIFDEAAQKLFWGQFLGSDAALKSRDNLCFFEDVGVEGFFAF